MKLVVVTQWVRTYTVQVPPDQSLASRSGANSTCQPSKGRTKLEWSEDAGRVIEPRNVYSRGQEDIPQDGIEGNADGVHAPEGSSPGRGMASAQDTTGV